MLVTFNKPSSPMDQALAAHQQGKLAVAEGIYRQVLAQNPNDPEANHMMGLLLHQSGKSAEGVILIERSLAQVPQNAGALSNLAEVTRAMGRYAEAEAHCRKAMALNPKLLPALHNLATILYQQGKLAEALPAALHAIEIGPKEATGYSVAGIVLLDSQRPREALRYLQEAVRLTPNDPSRMAALGACFERLDQLENALVCHRQAATLAPNDPRAIINVGAMLARMEKYAEAEPWFQKAVALEPNFTLAIEQLATVKLGLRDFDGAVALCRRSMALNPQSSDAYPALGESLMGVGKFDECIAEMKKGLAVKPSFAIHQTISNALVRDGKPDEGLAELEKALLLGPQNPVLHFNKAIILLLLGRMAEAWTEYEWRWQHPRMAGRSRSFNVPKWDGGPLQGKRIFLHAEQGLGDTIFFGRYVTLIAERGGIPLFHVQGSMVELAGTIPGVAEVIREGTTLPQFDLHLPIMSAPGIFKTTEETVPAKVPYISANPQKVAHWKAELAKRTSKFKVGLVWEGGPFQPENYLRSASLAAYAPLGEVPGVAFFALQKGTAEAQSKNPPPGMDFTDLGPFIKDFSDTAAILDNLDLLISIDTSVVHVAGALGKPVLMMLAYAPGHMWMFHRSDTPWYPTFKIFRQPAFQDWVTPVGQVKAELEKLVASQSKSAT